MSRPDSDVVSLAFPLEVKDGWPPVGVECLPLVPVGAGYKLLQAPLFIKDLSVDDVLQIQLGDPETAMSWSHLQRSERSTVWLLRLAPTGQVEESLAALRRLGCSTTSLDAAGCHAVDVPAEISIGRVDEILRSLNESEVAVAFPSMRHPDE